MRRRFNDFAFFKITFIRVSRLYNVTIYLFHFYFVLQILKNRYPKRAGPCDVAVSCVHNSESPFRKFPLRFKVNVSNDEAKLPAKPIPTRIKL